MIIIIRFLSIFDLKISPNYWGFYIYVMIIYGYLFGVIRILKDTHHDECFIEANGHVIIRNNRRIVEYHELVAIARSLNVNPWRLTIIDYDNLGDE